MYAKANTNTDTHKNISVWWVVSAEYFFLKVLTHCTFAACARCRGAISRKTNHQSTWPNDQVRTHTHTCFDLILQFLALHHHPEASTAVSHMRISDCVCSADHIFPDSWYTEIKPFSFALTLAEMLLYAPLPVTAVNPDVLQSEMRCSCDFHEI